MGDNFFEQVEQGLPPVVYDQPSSLSDLANLIVRFVNWMIVPILMSAALAVFFYGIGKYILQAENEEVRKEGKKYMLWGVIALFVMVSLWSIIYLVQCTFFLQNCVISFGDVDLRLPGLDQIFNAF